MRKKIILIISIIVIITLTLTGCSASKAEESTNTTTVLTTINESTTVATTGPSDATIADIRTTSNKVIESSTKAQTTTAVPATTKVKEQIQTTTQKAITKESTTKANAQSTTKPTTTKRITTTTKEINISEYESYAKSYAKQIGLILDSTATSWDNPITISSQNTAAKESIRDKLDWYKSTGITSVWVHSEKISDNKYNLYLTYA